MSLQKKLFISVFALMFFSLSSCSFAYEYIAGDVIVVLRQSDSDVRVTASSFGENGVGKLSASEFAVTAGASLKKVYPALSEADNNIFALIHSDDANPEELAKSLLKNPNVIAASPNYIVRAAVVPNDTYMSMLWGFEEINMPDVWDRETGSNNVYVAVVDSGIDWTNPDLAANTASNLGFTARGISASSYDGFDDYGHGSHVAGTIGAVSNNRAGIAGVNWYVRMIPVKVLDRRGLGTTDTLIEGMDYIADLMHEGYNIRAVNLSLEAYEKLRPSHDNLVSYPMWRAFKVIDEYNQAVLVVAAGNHGATVGRPTTYTKRDTDGDVIFEAGCYVYPASFKGMNNMISVSALGKSGNIASYSNTNADISAPGGDSKVDGSTILSTWIQNSRYVNEEGISLIGSQGTSMASPHVAGVAALLSAHNPDMTAYQIRQCIIGGAVAGGEDIKLDAAGALNYQEYYGTRLAREGTEDYDYRDWRSYSSYDPSSPYYEREGGSSSGGCNSFMLGAIAVMIFCPLARKFMN